MKNARIAVVGLITSALLSWNTQAASELRLSDGTPGGTVTIADQGPNDANPTPGVVVYIGPVGADWFLNVSSGTTKPAGGGPATPYMDLGTLNFSSVGNSSLTIEFSDTDFSASGSVTANIGGTTVGDVTYRTWADAGNILFAKTTPLTSLGPLPGLNFDATAAGVFALAAPFSLTIETVINHPIAGNTGFDAELYITPSCDCVVSIQCPAPTTVACGASTGTNAVPMPIITAGPTCNPIITTNDIITPGNCPGSYTIARTWTVTPQCGDAQSCTQIINVRDTTPPTISCSPNKTNECGTAIAFDTPTASDTCGNAFISVLGTVTNRTCGNTFVATRTWVATDDCGNTNVCSQTITTIDTTKPSIQCVSNKSVECASAWNFDAPSASDTCGNVVVEIVSTTTNATGRCGNTFVATRVWRATDECGNSDECSQTVTVIDTTAPSIVCVPNKTVECGSAWNFNAPSASDTCGNVTVDIISTVTNAVGFCGNTFEATRTWEATDACGNKSRCSQKVTVQDTTPPSISCVADKTVECGVQWSFDPPTASDTCGSATVAIVSTVTNGSGCTITATRTWEATDSCGRTARCSQTVTVRDSTPPVITCPPDFARTNEQGSIFCSYTPGGWGSPPNGYNPGAILLAGFAAVYPAGIEIGVPGNPGYSLKFTSAAAVQAYLPDGGTPGVLDADQINALTSTAGVFGQHVLALKLNVDFSAAGLIGGATPLGSLVLNLPGSSLNGLTINQILAAANLALGGGALPAGLSISDLNNVVDDLNNAFDNCTADDWAREHLLGGGRPQDPGVATATDNCDPAPTITFVDSTITPACGTVVIRTWYATDVCGNQSQCTQLLTNAPCPPLTLECPPNSGQVGVPYSGALVASGGLPPYTFSITAGALPTGLTLNPATGAITGIPTEAGTFAFSAQVVDSIGGVAGTATVNCSVNIIGVGGCRVTGGSNHQTNMFQVASITTALPTFVSHGGQVGAPFSVGTPFSPNSPCISGEWQHNRHLRGNSLVGTFHAAGNGRVHQFDSLLCACLPCAEDIGAVGVVGGVCNPGNRICGPEPRRAPANKICFSGVGDYTFTTGNKTVKAVFRVDIEDRSEGNSQAGSPPRDRYRIRLWILDGRPGRNPDPNSAEAMSIRYAASADPATIGNLATTEDLKVNIPPDIDDGGNMTQGNHQIHPETGAQCGDIVTASPARVDVSSVVALAPAAGATPSYGLLAQGFEGTQQPQFVYRTTITNSGIVPLTGITVLDTTGTNFVDVTSKFFAPGATLMPQGSVTVCFTNEWGADTVRAVTMNAVSALDGITPWFAGGSCMALVSVPAPTGLTAESLSGKVALSWNPEVGASYNVKRSTTSGGPYTTIKSSGSTTYTDSGLGNGKVYYYVVSAVKDGVETPDSSQVSAFPSAGLPRPWNQRDVGMVGIVGGGSYSSGTFSIAASGADIWGSRDEFHYVYQTASGDCSIVARVVSVGNTDPWAKAGVMVRETLTDGSKHASIFLTPGNGVSAQARTSTGSSSVNTTTAGPVAPYWVKIVRTGNTFSSYYSANGSSWTILSTRSISMASTVYIGLAVTSHDDSALTTAAFSNVTATP